MSSHEAIRVPCGDIYCSNCLKAIFLHATKDQILFPPRCCRQEISLDLAAPTMSSEEVEMFHNAQIEFATTNRTYCSNTNCGKFILPALVGHDRATCSHCGTSTCIHCKGTSHFDECPNDDDLQATLALAQEQGWRRCHLCGAIVELAQGCNHITCKCGGQFCYKCGVVWKACSCEAWDEENLLRRAEQVVDREAIRPLPQIERQRRVLEVRQELLERHECNHSGRFERITGGGRRGFDCEMCSGRHWKYILRCRRCHMHVCEDCRRHRVR